MTRIDASATAQKGIMTSSVKLSLIIPVYNALPYLVECADSVFSQDCPSGDFEVIFVDDGSTDGSEAYLDELASRHENARVFHCENSGTPAAPRNFGIEQARGTYVFFLDADDYLYAHALANMLAHAEESGCDLGLFKIERKEWPSNYSGLFDRAAAHCTIEDAPLLRFLGPFKLYARSLLLENDIRFPLGAWAEDQPFALECYFCAQNICVFNDQDYYHYRRRSDGVSATLGGLSASFDGPDAAFAGCKAYFEAADRYTSVHAKPFVYERGFENVRDAFERLAATGQIPRERARYRRLLAPYCTDELRGLLPLSILLLVDSLLLCEDDRGVVEAATFGASKARVEPGRDGSYRFVDADGGLLFEGRFPPADLVRDPLAAPRLARLRVVGLRAAEGGEARLYGNALAFWAAVERLDAVALRARDRKTGAVADFACSTKVRCAGRAYAAVSLFDFDWEGALDLGRCAALRGEAQSATLDLYLALFCDGEAFRELRLGAIREEGVEEAFGAIGWETGDTRCAPLTTGAGNFSLRLTRIEPPAPQQAKKKSGVLGKVKRRLKRLMAAPLVRSLFGKPNPTGGYSRLAPVKNG